MLLHPQWKKDSLTVVQLIPPEIKWDPESNPPQYTDGADQIIEKGTNLRLKIIGLRNDVRNMFAIGSIKEDYLGLVTLSPPPIFCY